MKCKEGSFDQIVSRLEEKKINLRIYSRNHIGVSLDEMVTDSDLEDLLYCFGSAASLVRLLA